MEKHRIEVEYFDNVAFEYWDIQYESEEMLRKRISGDMLFQGKVSL